MRQSRIASLPNDAEPDHEHWTDWSRRWTFRPEQLEYALQTAPNAFQGLVPTAPVIQPFGSERQQPA
jgi:hypothetical protein